MDEVEDHMREMENSRHRSFRDLHGRKTPRALWEILPQSVPYSINIDPTNLCNFRCPFCPTGNPAVLARVARPKGVMKLELFQKIIGDLRDLTRRGGRKIARLQLWKDGEPLLHQQFPEMIRLAKRAEVADSVEMTTNGSLLNGITIRGLIEAGPDVLRVSVEHVQDSVYQTISNGKVSYEDIRQKVSDLYSETKASDSSLHVHTKIIDAGLSEGEKARFVQDFAPISDSWNIDSISGWSRMQIQDFTLGIQTAISVDGMTPKRERLVCPEPFAKLAINFDGSTSVCCADWSHATIVGDVTRESVREIWNGERLASFRIRHLSGQRATLSACSSCDYLCCFPSFADLDEHREELLDLFQRDTLQR
jgi:radical SAM protein with 4Fe4S-binding SPASM domain